MDVWVYTTGPGAESKGGSGEKAGGRAGSWKEEKETINVAFNNNH